MSESVTIPSFDGETFDGYLFRAGAAPAPGLVMIPEIYGVNRFLRETAQRFAEAGYSVLAIDIFWRLARNVDLQYAGEEKRRANALHDDFDYALGVKDVQSAVTALRRHAACTGTVGVTGYCLGGTLAYLAAARTDAEAAAGYYGTRIHDFLEDGPRIAKPLLLHFGELDHNTPPERLEQIRAATGSNRHVTEFVYAGAKHAFANHIRPDRYHPAAARLADERTLSFFGAALS